ncbi:hypothetical protein OROMI_000468 [Orobanche minor]
MIKCLLGIWILGIAALKYQYFLLRFVILQREAFWSFIGGLTRHVFDGSPNVKRLLCLRGLVQASLAFLADAARITNVIVALFDDPDDSVLLTAISCLLPLDFIIFK